MPKLHIICQPVGIAFEGGTRIDDARHIWESAAWDFTLEDAHRLIGGQILLHKTKKDPSYFGGEVIDVRQVRAEDKAHKDRVAFIFKADSEAKGQAWSGKDHGMAWTSGIVD